jgi:hypothetical protein
MTTQSTGNLPAPAQPVGLGMPANVSGFVRFASTDGDDRLGDNWFLSGKTGQATVGQQRLEVKLPRKYAILFGVPQAQVGYLEWLPGGKVGRSDWVSLRDPESNLEELREALGDNDPTQWKQFTPKGKPKDPLSLSARLPMVDWETGQLVTYPTSAKSHVKAIQRLVKACVVQMRAAPDTTLHHVPVAEIGVHSYELDTGDIFVPHFTVLDWVPERVIVSLLGKSGCASQLGLSNQESLNADLAEETLEQPAPKAKGAKTGPRL